MRLRHLLVLLAFVLAPQAAAWAQEVSSSALSDCPPMLLLQSDSITTSAQESLPDFTKQAQQIRQEVLWQPNSTKAILWGLLPGGGQIYNRKYWKLPIVWGSFVACYYAITWNNRQYQEYHAAYRDLSSADPEHNTAWLVFAPNGAKASDYQQYQSSLRPTLKRGNDFYRRNRDLSVVTSILVYGLSILDAYVDAELFTFDISPDLSLRIAPEVGFPQHGIPSLPVGVNCSLTF